MSLASWFPLVGTLRDYRREDARADAVAGLTVALVAIPQSMAYAIIAQVPPAYGLYAFIVSSIVCALFNSSSFVSAGPSNAVSLLVASRLAARPDGTDPETMLFALTLLVGAIQVLLALIRAGALVNYISNAVIAAYMAGAGLLIVANQIPNLLGVLGPRSPGFAGTLRQVWEQIPNVRLESLALGAGTLAAWLVLKRLSPRLPSMLIAIALAAGATAILHLDASSDARPAAVKLVRDVQGGVSGSLPTPRILPFTLSEAQDLSGAAFAIAILSLAQGLSVARAFAAKSGQPISPNREFAGLGLANAAAAFFQGIPGSGSLVRSAVSFESGARTRLVNVFAGLVTAVLILSLAPLANRIPTPALAGIVIGVGASMVDFHAIRSIFSSTRTDMLGYTATFACAITLPERLELSIFVGVAFSILAFIRQASSLHVTEMVASNSGQFREIGDEKQPTCAQISLLHIEGSLFFGAAFELSDRLREIAARKHPHVIILRVKRARHIDLTTLEVLRDFAHSYRARGGHLLLCGVAPELMAMLDRLGLSADLAPENIFPARDDIYASTQEAVRRARGLLATGSCPCHGRFFADCPAPAVTEM
ncbi:MAG: SulP family inorganic anion transporter [Planctomycetota bacterium]